MSSMSMQSVGQRGVPTFVVRNDNEVKFKRKGFAFNSPRVFIFFLFFGGKSAQSTVHVFRQSDHLT